MEHPLVLLPEPSNAQAMAVAAIRNLALSGTETQPTEATAPSAEPLVAETTTAEVEEAAIQAAKTLNTILQPSVEPALPIPVSAPRTRLIFGQRLSDQRTRRDAKPMTHPNNAHNCPAQLDLFGDLRSLNDTPPHHTPAQASLF